MSEELTPQSEENILEEYTDHVIYEYASQGQRFLNFLFDNLLMTYGLSYVSGIIIGYLLLYLAPDYLHRISSMDRTSIDFLLFSYILGVFNYMVYYSICEKAFRGYTLGKLITGSRAIREDGDELRFKDVLLRSLTRLVPFEVFSAIGRRPWHDSWTKTTVIRSRN